jgi:hypothetical protein
LLLGHIATSTTPAYTPTLSLYPVVTVLDSAGAAFEVLAGLNSNIENPLVKLGTLQGTGTVTMP